MRVLLADNHIEHRFSLMQSIEKLGHNVEEALAGSDIINQCRLKCPDLLLLASHLAPVPVIRQIRQLGGNAVWNPIVILSETLTEELCLQYAEAGVDDVLLQPVPFGEIALKISTALRHYRFKEDVFSVAHNLVVANRALENVVTQDSLTGVNNSNSFEDMLEREWFRLKKAGLPLALLYVNLDYFQLYNQQYGAEQGDECLKKIAELLKVNLGGQGKLARTAGATFAILLPNTELPEANALAKKLQDDIKALNIPHAYSGCSKQLTVSIGISVVNAHEYTAPWDLTEAADYALYQAKHYGRNRSFFVPAKEVEGKSTS